MSSPFLPSRRGTARRARPVALAAVLAVAALAALAAPAAMPAAASAAQPAIRHVFVIVLENESASTTFGVGTPAPYLASTLTAHGAYLPNYYGVGHHSLDNYIAMISGQAPNTDTSNDCPTYGDFPTDATGAYDQQEGAGCVYPADIPTLASQLTAAHDTWRDYNEDMGADPSRESATCGHPVVGGPDNTESAEPTDMYASRHDPFVYFHSIIDDTALCDSHVVNLNDLPPDLASPAATPSYSYITPDLCDDGHDSPCADGEPGGLAQADTWLQTWVPKITASAAFREDGLLIITFDESESEADDSTSCCGEIAGPGEALPGQVGPGGGDVGAVLLSPCIAPGTVSQTPYNHYTMLGSVENIFGLPHLGYAGLPGETYFGSDIFKRPCGPDPPTVTLTAKGSSKTGHYKLSWKASVKLSTAVASYQVQDRPAASHGAWKTLAKSTTETSASFKGRAGQAYAFRVRAVNLAGQISSWAT
jgi:hypothetical protein